MPPWRLRLALLFPLLAANSPARRSPNCLPATPPFCKQRDVGAVPQALASYQRCLELLPPARNAGQNALLALNYTQPGELPCVWQAHLDWGQRLQADTPPLPPHEERPPRDEGDDAATTSSKSARRLRLGYISPDLLTHSVSYFAEGPLTHHDANSVSLHVYSCAPRPDERTARLRAAVEAAGGVWRDVAALSERQLAEAVAADGVDVLVELTGHTAGNRLGTMAMRPAPVQVGSMRPGVGVGLRFCVRVH